MKSVMLAEYPFTIYTIYLMLKNQVPISCYLMNEHKKDNTNNT